MKTPLFLLAILLSLSLRAQNNLLQISGEIRDQKTGELVTGAIVQVKTTLVATTTDANGKLVLKAPLKFPFTIEVSLVGYERQEFVVNDEHATINLQLAPQVLLVNEVVVSASRTEESILKSPVAIDKLDIIAIRETP